WRGAAPGAGGTHANPSTRAAAPTSQEREGSFPCTPAKSVGPCGITLRGLSSSGLFAASGFHLTCAAVGVKFGDCIALCLSLLPYIPDILSQRTERPHGFSLRMNHRPNGLLSWRAKPPRCRREEHP